MPICHRCRSARVAQRRLRRPAARAVRRRRASHRPGGSGPACRPACQQNRVRSWRRWAGQLPATLWRRRQWPRYALQTDWRWRRSGRHSVRGCAQGPACGTAGAGPPPPTQRAARQRPAPRPRRRRSRPTGRRCRSPSRAG